MTQITTFNGGLNTRVAPQLAQVNESIRFTNASLLTGSLKSTKSAGDSLTASRYAYYFSKKDEWFSKSENALFAEIDERIFYTSSSGLQMYDGDVDISVGIPGPTNAIVASVGTFVGATLPVGTYQYLYTFYNSKLGWESEPSPLSNIVTTTSIGRFVQLVIPDEQPVSEVDMVRIYVLSSNLATWESFETIEVALSVGGIRNQRYDLSVNEGLPLISTDHQLPDVAMTNIVATTSLLLGSIGKFFVWSKPGYEYAFPTVNFIQLDAVITGIKVVTEGYLVFTRIKAYIIAGVESGNIFKYQLSDEQGCVSHRSIQTLGGIVVWMSTDGLCAKIGSKIEVISKVKLGYDKVSATVAVVHNEVYYYYSGDGFFAYDVRFSPAFVKFDEDISFLLIGDEKLYGYFNSGYKELFKGLDDLTLYYTSPEFSDGDLTERKNYKSIYVNCVGSFTVDILIDGKKVLTKSIVTGVSELKIPQKEKNGYTIQFRVVGTGEVKAISYQPFGRTND